MILFLARLCPQSRRRLGSLLMPSDNARLAELRQLDAAQRRFDPSVSRCVEPIHRLATASQIVGAVIGERIGDGVGTIERREITGLFPGLLIEPSSCALLRLC